MNVITLRLPGELLLKARRLAKENNQALEQWLTEVVARTVVAQEGQEFLKMRARRGKMVDVNALLAKAPDVEPAPGDRIEP